MISQSPQKKLQAIPNGACPVVITTLTFHTKIVTNNVKIYQSHAKLGVGIRLYTLSVQNFKVIE